MNIINKVNEITSKELICLMDEDKKVVIIDVREAEEIQLGMIEGAIHIPLQSIPAYMVKLNKINHYVFVCRSGVRSLDAAKYVNKKGIKSSNLLDGMIGWTGETIS